MSVVLSRWWTHPLLFVTLALPALAATGDAAPAAAAEPPAADAPAELAARYRDFLAEAAPLISDEERAAFLALKQDYQREAFIRRFWQVRDPYPQTARNELLDRWSERTTLARERYGDLAEDRAKVLLLLGEPLEVLPSRCSDLLLPLEIWAYPGPERGGRGGFTLVFVQPQGAVRGRYRLWSPGHGLSSLLALELRGPGRDGSALQAIGDDCPRGDEVLGGIAAAADWQRIEAQLVPRPSGEWLASFLAASTEVPEGAAAFPARLDLAFPGRHGSRTVLQGVLSVPRDDARPQQLGEVTVYSYLIDGEILRHDELFDRFRYRFSVPQREVRDGAIPLLFERYLRPGAYRLLVRIEEIGSGRYFRDERTIEVPSVPDAPPPQVARVAEAPAAASPALAGVLAEALAEANTSLGAGAAPSGDEPSIRLLPTGEGLLVGRARLEAMTAGAGIVKVSFRLDGKPVLSKNRPPFSVEIDLGPQPRLHKLEAQALAADGSVLASDEVVLNAGPHRFAVRLVEPAAGHTYRSSVRVRAEVDLPEGETLDRVELYLNDDLVATLFQEPFAQPLLLPAGGAVTYVRALAYLAGGTSTEDTVLVNALGYQEVVDVELVELYTTVVDRKGRPVEGLTRDDFAVREDGAAQELRRFELVRDLPIWAGVVLDTSGSMQEELDDAVRAALQFFQSVLTPKDRAAVVTFADEPTLAVRFTSDPEVLAGGLAGIKADGNTALYDSLIFALHYFGGLKGKRALVVISDGKDEGSSYRFEDALEYARRSGVAIYTIGLGLPTREADVRFKLQRLADETGGRAFFIERASGLVEIYEHIEREVRFQYLLAYQSSQAASDDRFRTVEVELKQPGLEAKTLKGYYP